jgi:hypothetical protein
MSDHDRVLLVGLDGATFSVLDPLMADGTMPFLRNFDPAPPDSGGVDNRDDRAQPGRSRGL